ncbi:hypothetical protein GCM10010378_64590 [Streptomyces viridochromogenes]
MAAAFLAAALCAVTAAAAPVPEFISAATAPPAPSTTEAPRPAASTAARVRNADVRGERREKRGDIRNLTGKTTGKAIRHMSRTGWRHPLVTPLPPRPKTPLLRHPLVRAPKNQ